MSMLDKNMQGKICMVTGANSGIGKVTALELAKMGATVVMVCRNRAKGEETQREIQQQSGNDAVDLMIADLSSQQAIRQLAQEFQQRYSHLHVLVNNAGGAVPQRQMSVDGIEMTFAVNYLASFLLTNLLLDTIQASAPARIINVSSDAQTNSIDLNDLQRTKKYRIFQVYGQAKTALVLFTYALAQKLAGTGVTVNALHPGVVATNFMDHAVPPFAQPFARPLISIFKRFLIQSEEGAKTTLYLATSPEVEGVTGKYFDKCKEKPSVPISYDKSLQQQIWDIGEKLTGLLVPARAE